MRNCCFIQSPKKKKHKKVANLYVNYISYFLYYSLLLYKEEEKYYSMASYKQRCGKCKKNWVLMSWRGGFPICYDCQKDDLIGEITDPEMKKLFDVPEELYKQSSFLCNIKKRYLQAGHLSEKQVSAFKQVVEKLTNKESEKVNDNGKQ